MAHRAIVELRRRITRRHWGDSIADDWHCAVIQRQTIGVKRYSIIVERQAVMIKWQAIRDRRHRI